MATGPGGVQPLVVLTNAAGFVANSYDYDAYGNIEASVEAIANPFTYTGREFDAESGLYYYRARYYDPATGRFINQDPIGFGAGDLNLYRYVFNDPVNLRDPNGQNAGGVIGAEIGLVAGPAGAVVGAVVGGIVVGIVTILIYDEIVDAINERNEGESSADEGAAAGSESSDEDCPSGSGGDPDDGDGDGNGGPKPPLEKPTGTEDPGLKDAFDKLFQENDEVPGGTAGAVREELRTGEPVGGKFHSEKAQGRARQIEKILNKNNLNPADRRDALNVMNDLLNALSGN